MVSQRICCGLELNIAHFRNLCAIQASKRSNLVLAWDGTLLHSAVEAVVVWATHGHAAVCAVARYAEGVACLEDVWAVAGTVNLAGVPAPLGVVDGVNPVFDFHHDTAYEISVRGITTCAASWE